MLKVTEIFDSIQGEGTQMGLPMTFVRLSGCNLRCSWCDTKYSWEEDIEIREEDVVEQCKQQWVCITGGEPCIQDFDMLTYLLKKAGYKITVETNGTILPKPLMLAHVDFWSISPKTGDYTSAMKVFVYKKNVQWKFVVQNQEDMKKYVCWIEHHLCSDALIVFQPERFSHEKDYMQFLGEMVEFVKAYRSMPIRVLPQLHWIIWGGRRGI